MTTNPSDRFALTRSILTKSIVGTILVLAYGTDVYTQDASYYKAIQMSSSSSMNPEQFKKIEENAFKNYFRPEVYEPLARVFGNTTEKVWAVIYGEVYCNLSPDSEGAAEIGSLVYDWYSNSLSKTGTHLSIDLTENAQALRNQIPFESQFEQMFLMGAVSFGNEIVPLSIRKLTEIRRKQLALWTEKGLPQTELTRRQSAISAAGHFEAYNYWLFKGARPEEFSGWLKSHQTQFQAWLDWQNKNQFSIHIPDFQRLYLLRGR